MAEYLRVQDGIAVEAWTAPDGEGPSDCFPADLASAFHEAGDAKVGWLWGDEVFSEPAAPPVPLPVTQHDFLGFLTLFSPAEQAAIVSSDNVQVRLFCLMAAGANFVDLADPRVVQGTQLLEKLDLIGKGRATQVLAGDPVEI